MFFGTHIAKIDSKNRASVPAAFRNHILESGPAFKGVAVFPSLKAEDPAYIGCNPDYLSTLDRRIREGDFDPEVADAIADAVFPYVEMLNFDDGGRVVLSKDLRAHVGLDGGEVAFVGKGVQTFEIWSPAVRGPRAKASREKAGAGALAIMFDRGRSNREPGE